MKMPETHSLNPPKGRRPISTLGYALPARITAALVSQSPEGSTADFHKSGGVSLDPFR